MKTSRRRGGGGEEPLAPEKTHRPVSFVSPSLQGLDSFFVGLFFPR